VLAPRKIVEKSAKFSALKNVRFSVHVYQPIHHTLTTKKPSPALAFSKNPLKKRENRAANPG
jgi:hypothetical protein